MEQNHPTPPFKRQAGIAIIPRYIQSTSIRSGAPYKKPITLIMRNKGNKEL